MGCTGDIQRLIGNIGNRVVTGDTGSWQSLMKDMKILKNINKAIEIKQKEHMKKSKEYIIARLGANQRRNRELQQLERLHELKEQTFENLNSKYNHELLNNLEILGI